MNELLPPDAIVQLTASAADTVASFWPVAALISGVFLAFGIIAYLLQLLAGKIIGGIETKRKIAEAYEEEASEERLEDLADRYYEDFGEELEL